MDLCGSPNGTIALLRPQSWRHTEPLHSHDEGYHSRQPTDRCNHSQTVVADKCRGDGEAVSGVLVEKQPSAMTDTRASSQAPMTRRKRLVGSLEPSSGFFSLYFLAFAALRINEEVVFWPMLCLFEIQFFNHINRSDIPDQFCRAGVNLYIKLRRPCEISCLLTLYVCLFVRCVCQSLVSFCSRKLWPDSVHCHLTGYNGWLHLGQVRLWPFNNRCIIVSHPITLCRLTHCQ